MDSRSIILRIARCPGSLVPQAWLDLMLETMHRAVEQESTELTHVHLRRMSTDNRKPLHHSVLNFKTKDLLENAARLSPHYVLVGGCGTNNLISNFKKLSK